MYSILVLISVTKKLDDQKLFFIILFRSLDPSLQMVLHYTAKAFVFRHSIKKKMLT